MSTTWYRCARTDHSQNEVCGIRMFVTVFFLEFLAFSNRSFNVGNNSQLHFVSRSFPLIVSSVLKSLYCARNFTNNFCSKY
jgi:hypothetical protein